MRIAAKILLARLPVPYRVWKRLRVFEHGDMNDPQLAFNTMLTHARSAGVVATGASLPRFLTTGTEFNVLELGPGDSLFSAVIAKAFGASNTWMVDAGSFATKEMPAYGKLFDFLRDKGFAVPAGNTPHAIEDVLGECGGKYLTDGVGSMTGLSAASIDFCFSNAVLEHIPKGDFAKLTRELKRILKPAGACLHRVDLQDHLGGGLNNLRFSEARWEGSLFRNSGFYTNRIRYGEMADAFSRAGFQCVVSRVNRWNSLPVDRSSLDASFRHLPDEDLLVSGFDIVLRHSPESGHAR